MKKITLGISACLLGETVRYDGGHKYEPLLIAALGKDVSYLPVCPEAECGLGIPREVMRLVGQADAPRLLTVQTGLDHTGRMLRWAEQRVKTLEADALCGFIFKSRSPSCGMAGVKIHSEEGLPVGEGTGLFARMFMEHFSRIPMEEEERLRDPQIREDFIRRLFCRANHETSSGMVEEDE